MDLLDKKQQEQPAIEEEVIEKTAKIEHYELLYILSASFTAEEIKPIIAKIETLIKDNGGQIGKTGDLGKLKFAYPIKHQSHGYYQLAEFDLPAANLKKLNSLLTLIPEILRFLVVKQKIKTDQEIAQEKAFQEKLAKKKGEEIEKIKAKKEEGEKAPKPKAERINLEDLDKKLDEILDTDNIV
jgi:small subunit ribosomal protein S6